MKTTDFDYHLPKELIAQIPADPRDHSRLLVLSRDAGSIEHRHFYDLRDYLRPDDVLVFNDSRVIPARLYGTRTDTGRRVEILLLCRLSSGLWSALVRPGRKLQAGTKFEVAGVDARILGTIVDQQEGGLRTVHLVGEEHIQRLGRLPVPPYIHEPLGDPERYQTVYSRIQGSVAAPTAGLHFTPGLLDQPRTMSVEMAFVTLHVGWDSFRPVSTEAIGDHTMHSEYWELGQEAVDTINRAKSEGRRVISVGTTAARLLEQVALDCATKYEDMSVAAGSGWADIFIYPGHQFRVVDALITNFHLPRSSLLMLTSALGGREVLLRAYQEAVSQNYRFYSFGDAMFLI